MKINRKLIFLLLISILSYILYSLRVFSPFLKSPDEKYNLSLFRNDDHGTQSNALFDLKPFVYLENPSLCGRNETVLAVVLIHSHPNNHRLRQVHRDELQIQALNDIGLKRVFLLGQAIHDQDGYPAVPQDIIRKEASDNGDIVQGNFVEHYHNLTYKHTMGLSWVTQFCSQSSFVIKMDDDIAVDLFQIRQMIRYRFKDLKNEMLGLIEIDNPAIRHKDSKWRVSENEFKGYTYPKFLSGWCYIAPYQTIEKIVSRLPDFPYFWIDDAFITGIVAEKLDIERRGLNNKFTTSVDYLRCCVAPIHESDVYYCDYIAAPTDKDVDLLRSALKQFYNCYSKGCGRRTGTDTLYRTCIISKKPNEMPTGPGIGEVINLPLV